MSRWEAIRGRLHGRFIELDCRAAQVEDGEVELQIRSVQSATAHQPDLPDVIATLPEGRRAKEDVDQQLAGDRSDWPGRV